MNHLPQQAFSTAICLDSSERLRIERRLLSQMMVDWKLTTARAMLTPDHFLEPLHGQIWAAMIELDSQMVIRSAPRISDRLKRRGIVCNKRRWLQILEMPIVECDYISAHFEGFCLQLRTWADDVAEYRAAVATLERLSK